MILRKRFNGFFTLGARYNEVVIQRGEIRKRMARTKVNSMETGT